VSAAVPVDLVKALLGVVLWTTGRFGEQSWHTSRDSAPGRSMVVACTRQHRLRCRDTVRHCVVSGCRAGHQGCAAVVWRPLACRRPERLRRVAAPARYQDAGAAWAAVCRGRSRAAPGDGVA
jgi:hypothetical protein